MTRPWNREDDALIARVAEGWRDDRKRTGYWVDSTEVSRLFPPDYPADLLASVRAAEAWRKKDPGRWWSIESPNRIDSPFLACCYFNGNVEESNYDEAEAGTPAEALALALRSACEGER